MPLRRDLSRMSDEEALLFLRANCRGVLGTAGNDGVPHLVPLFYGVDVDGRPIVTSFAKAQKVINLERRPGATLLVETGAAYHEIRAVMAMCTAQILRDPDEVRENLALICTDRPMLANDTMREQVDASHLKRVAIRLTPYRFIGWDYSRLGGAY